MVRQRIFLKELKNKVLSYDDKAQVIFFGSRARGDYKEGSDWDILIVTENEADYVFQRSVRDEIFDMELKYSIPFSTIIMNRKKWKRLGATPLYKNIAAEGKHL